METMFNGVLPVLPALDVAASLKWWVEMCGFVEVFRHGAPVSYAGMRQGTISIHLALVSDAALARTVGEQTMIRLSVPDIHRFHREYQQRGGTVHVNGGLAEKPWGGLEFSAIDPGGVCVTFREETTP